MGNGKMTITDAATRLRITPKTIIRWEKAGKVQRAKRDWRGWRIYEKEDFKKLRNFKETIIIPVFILFLLPALAFAKQQENNEVQVIETPQEIQIHTPSQATGVKSPFAFDPMKYTLGPEDAVEISVMRHPEFSGKYPISQEGKLQYAFVGDIFVQGLTKLQLEEKLKEALSAYIIAPEVNVTVTEYKSKVYYIIGEVGSPGKYYMRSEAISVRDAIFQAGLPTQSAAMRKCQLITPNLKGNAKIRNVNIYSILYGGNLKKNIDMHPGDVLYVPSTVMAKVIRVINPVASTVGLASSPAESASKARIGIEAIAK